MNENFDFWKKTWLDAGLLPMMGNPLLPIASVHQSLMNYYTSPDYPAFTSLNQLA
jgi:hypothetical protein